MQKMMDALVKPERAKGLILTQVPVPEPGIGEVLIKIHKTAICGTDVHIYNWDPWSQQHINPPMVIGHEYVGEIAALGPGVTEYKVGQIVSGEGHIVCGPLPQLPRGQRPMVQGDQGRWRRQAGRVCGIRMHTQDQCYTYAGRYSGGHNFLL